MAECQDENCFNVDGAFYLLCIYKESFRLESFFFTEETMKAFIADSDMFLATRDRGSMIDKNEFRNTCNTVRSFVGSRTNILKEFKRKCRHKMNIRKKNAEDTFFLFLDTTLLLQQRKTKLMMKQNKSE